MMRAAAISNDPIADETANEVLRDGGSAVGAALGGFFASAGDDPAVLFSPVTILVAGVGTAARAFDGRCRQPGVGAKRPRGFTTPASVPDAARVAIPASVAAAVVACAYDPGATVNSVVRRGIMTARKAGAKKRAALLDRVLQLGAGILSDPALRSAMLGDAGPAQGGLVVAGDMVPPQGLDAPAIDDGSAFRAPWAGQETERSVVLGEGRAVCAVDVRGLFAAVTYRRLGEGMLLADFEVELPKLAVPVLRGVTRVFPGSPLAAPAPVAIRRNAAGQTIEIVASPRGLLLGEEPELTVRRDPATLEATAIRTSI